MPALPVPSRWPLIQTPAVENILNEVSKPIKLETGQPVQKSVIWLHGLGASGDDFVPLVPELGLPGTPGIRFVFPHAPVRPVTINNGMSMPGWFDITSLDFEAREQDLAGMAASVELVNALIQDEIDSGVNAENIVLAGFSQGGAIALMAALQSQLPLAGVMGLSTYLPDAARMLELYGKTGRSTNNPLPVFLAHGLQDDVILIRFAEQSREAMAATNALDLEWHSYPMPHSVSPEEIGDISVWLKKVLGI